MINETGTHNQNQTVLVGVQLLRLVPLLIYLRFATMMFGKILLSSHPSLSSHSLRYQRLVHRLIFISSLLLSMLVWLIETEFMSFFVKYVIVRRPILILQLFHSISSRKLPQNSGYSPSNNYREFRCFETLCPAQRPQQVRGDVCPRDRLVPYSILRTGTEPNRGHSRGVFRKLRARPFRIPAGQSDPNEHGNNIATVPAIRRWKALQEEDGPEFHRRRLGHSATRSIPQFECQEVAFRSLH